MLKALGISTGEVSSIFLIEAVIMSVLAYSFAAVIVCGFIYLVNNRYVSQVKGHEILYLYWDWKVGIVVLVITVLLSVLSVIIPIAKLARKKPVDIIRTINV